ncbi:unnamed protein product, partial [Pylaiella littoralis]
HDIYFSGDIIWMHLCAIVIMPQAGGMLEYLRHERIHVWKWILVRGTLLLLGFGIVCVGLFMRMRFGVGSAFVMLSHGCATTTAVQFNSYG